MDNRHIGATGKPNSFNKGMITDASPLNQPEGSYRFGLNLTRGTKEGNREVKASEHGNEFCLTLPEGYLPIGSDYINSTTKVIFAVNEELGESIIGKAYDNCKFEIVIQSKCLNFSIQHQIQVVNRVRRGCEDIVYFTDDYNPVKTINLTELAQYYTLEYTQHLEEGKTEDSFEGEKWDCSKFELTRELLVPYVEDVQVRPGGQVKSGSVNFAVRLLDEDFNPTSFGPDSGTVNVYGDYTLGQHTYVKILGSSNIDTDPFGGTQNSGKSLNVTVANIDPRYPYYQLVVMVASSWDSKVTDYWISPVISSSVETYTVNGDFSGFTPTTLEEVRADAVSIKTAKTIAQQENRLILGNVKGRQYDVCGFQKFASKICQEYIVDEVEVDDIHSIGDAKNPLTPFHRGSHQGDEVAANGIVYVWDDGTLTQAYHIPGPPKDTLPCAGGTKQSSQYKCIKGWVDVTTYKGEPCPTVGVLIEYTIDGVPYTHLALWEPQEIYEVFCGPGDYDFQITYEQYSCDNSGDSYDPLIHFNSLVTYKTVSDGEELDEGCSYINSVGQFVPSKNEVVDGWDSEIIETWSEEIRELAPQKDEDGVPYEEWDDSLKVQRWQLYNTAVKLGDTFGRPGYYEAKNSLYPDIRDCEGNSVWGVDACGNPLVGTPIRHSRLPDRRTEPLIIASSADEYEYCLNVQYKATKETTIKIYYTEGGVNKNIEVILPFTGTIPYTLQVGCSLEEVLYISHEVIGEDSTTFLKISEGKKVTKKGGKRVARILGFQFSNIEYPHPDIVGHFFVTSIREDKDKTVVDAGITGRLKIAAGNAGFAYFTSGANFPGIGYYLTPEFLVENKDTQGRQLAYQGQYRHHGNDYNCEDLDGAGSVFSNVDTVVDARRQTYGEYTVPAKEFSPIDEIHSLNGISFIENYIPPSGDLVNLSMSNRMQIVDVQDSIPKDGHDLFYVYSRLYRNVYADLYNIVYRDMTHKVLTLEDDQRVFGGDTYITQFNVNNSLLRSIFNGYWDDVLKVVLIIVAVIVTIYTAGAGSALFSALGVAVTAAEITTAAVIAGAIGVTTATVIAIKDRYKSKRYDQLAKDTTLQNCSHSWFEDSFIAYANERLEGLYVESQIPFALRQEIIGECGSIYKGESLLDFFIAKVTQYNQDEDKYEPRAIICPEVYWVNPAFSRVNKEKIYLPVPRTFKCCTDCLEKFPNRFIWSEVSFQEEVTDNYRVFLPNNYKDIDAQHGEIINIAPYYQNLLIQAADNLWVSISALQERITGEVISFLGTGEAFSNPERKAIDDDLGAVGCLHQWGILKTKFGVFIPDEKENSLYLYGSGVKDLFVGKMKAWAHKNFKGHLAESLKALTGEEFSDLDNHANPEGVGIHSTYDPMFRRVLITKRDYEIIASNFKAGKPNEVFAKKHKPLMYYIDGEFVLYDGQEFTPASFSDTRYFRNRSFTLSYSPETQEFVAFHSYIPLMYFRDKNTFFSSTDEKIWQHNADNVLSFYGKRHSTIIEGVDNTDPTTDKYTDYLAFFTEAKRIEGQGSVDVGPVTFDKVVVYNSTQTTGELNIQIGSEAEMMTESVKEDTDKIILGRLGKDYYINDLWDATKGEQVALFRDDWQTIAPNFFIDKVPNVSILQGISDWDILSPLYDKYLIYRFTFTSKDDTSLVIHYVTPGSYRSQL